MKKLLTCLTLSLTVLVSSSVVASNFKANDSIILHVNSSTYDSNFGQYISQVQDEKGDVYIIQSYDDISNQWLDASIDQYGEILEYTFLNQI